MSAVSPITATATPARRSQRSHGRPDDSIYAVSIPAREFTGDFYFTAQRGDRFWLALGDVAGKGLHAAVYMAMIQEELERLTIRGDVDPTEVIASINATLKKNLPSNRFATAVFAVFDHSERLIVVNAGHCPVLIRRANGTVEILHSTGPVLGVFEPGCWKSDQAILRGGDMVLFYTDGLLEARDPNGEEFGLDRIVRSFAAARRDSVRACGRAIVREVEEFTRGVRHDDLSLLIASHPFAPSLPRSLAPSPHGGTP